MSKSLKWILGIISVGLVINLAVVTALLLNNSSQKAKQEVAPTKVEAEAETGVKEKDTPEDPPIVEDSYAEEETAPAEEPEEEVVSTEDTEEVTVTDENDPVVAPEEDASAMEAVRQEAIDYLEKGAIEESGAAGTDYGLCIEVLKQAVDSYVFLHEENADLHIRSEGSSDLSIPDIYIYAIMEYADANDERMYYLNELDESLQNYASNQQFYLDAIDSYYITKANGGDVEEAALNVKDGEYAVEAAKQFVVEAMETLRTL